MGIPSNKKEIDEIIQIIETHDNEPGFAAAVLALRQVFPPEIVQKVISWSPLGAALARGTFDVSAWRRQSSAPSPGCSERGNTAGSARYVRRLTLLTISLVMSGAA